jgi:hypothetical protein
VSTDRELRKEREAKAAADTTRNMELHCLFFNKPMYDLKATTRKLNDILTKRQYVLYDDKEKSNGRP